MDRPPEFLKPFANHLANVVASDENARIIRLLRLTGLLFESQPRDVRSSLNGGRGAPEPDRVGIWKRSKTSGNASFVRTVEHVNEWNMWANRGRIDAKTTKLRVILIGESVARGYLYDPLFTPATVLEQLLQPYCGIQGVEVIDLARLGLLQNHLKELARSAMILGPDALVIFAGNNWGVSASVMNNDPDYRRTAATILRAAGVMGLKQFVEDKVELESRSIVEEIASEYQHRQIPVFWIVPEFNLADWRDPESNAPYLPRSGNREWLRLREHARSALEHADVSAAVESASRMTDLDRGVCVSGLYLLAECSRRSGDHIGERRYLERARDALMWENSGYIPSRAYTAVQQALRREVRKHGMSLIDLPQVFSEHLNGELPDRRLFVDHCHLTSDGIRVSMAAVAMSLIKRFTGASPHWKTLLADDRILPCAEVEGEAAFLAAVHNAHWWQSSDVVTYFCLRAVEKSRDIIDTMLKFSELQIRRAPTLMSRPAEQLTKSGSGLIHFYAIQYRKHVLDQIFLSALESCEHLGINRRDLERMQRQEHSIARKDNNLLDYYYCSAGRQPRELMWSFARQSLHSWMENRADYYKAYSRESRFFFIGETKCAPKLSLTCRLSRQSRVDDSMTRDREIRITVNGKVVAELRLGYRWSSWHINISHELVKDGLNEVVLQWPEPEFPGDEELGDMYDHWLNTGRPPDFYPVFGEIHSFVATAAQEEQMRITRGASQEGSFTPVQATA